jgi:DNA topoisomerase-3
MILIENLKPESLKSPLMTSEWEEKLSLIEQGKIKPSEFALEMNNFVFDIIEESEKMSHKFDGIKTNKQKGNFQKKKITSIQSFFNR